jgi:DNA-binding GntR family transcriptional regulator
MKPIERRSLHDELLARLTDMIVDGELPPGAKVPERKLCEIFGVSRTPLREALKVLAAENLVVLAQNRGAAISDVNFSELEECFPVMAELEALSGKLCCRAITDAEVHAIREATHAMRKAHDNADVQAYFKLNRQIHEGMLAATRNELLSAHYQRLSRRVRRARLAANISQERRQAAMDEHEEILVLLDARDGDSLSVLLRRHILNLLDYYRRVMRAAHPQG